MKTETVTLPSGRKVEIRQPGPRGIHLLLGVLPTAALLDAGETTDLDADRARRMTPAERAANVETQIALVCACSVDPRFSAKDPTPAGHKDIDDLEMPDFAALVEECVRVFDETKEQAAAAVGP